MRTIMDAAMSTGPYHRVDSNIERTQVAQEQMTQQMGQLLQVNVAQLQVQHHQLAVEEEQLAVQHHQLRVQDQIRQIGKQQLAVNQEQLLQAIRTVGRLDTTNQKLAQIDSTLGDISGILVEQNSLIQKSLNRLATEAQELIARAENAFNNGWHEDAAKDFDKVLEKDPYSPIAHYFRAKCYAQAGQKDEAQREYDKCIYYARRLMPIFENLALCDLALLALDNKQKKDARRFIDQAMQCPEQDRLVTIRAALKCDVAEGKVNPATRSYIEAAFKDETVDPEVLLKKVLRESFGEVKVGKDGALGNTTSLWKQWEQAANESLFRQTVSHFYRELDDYVYLAPRIRRGFMEAANGQFLALGDPLADLLDWTTFIGEKLLSRIECFTPDHVEILKWYRVLKVWNPMLVQLGKLTSLLAARSALVSGQFVGQLNIGLLELPAVYEDDKVIFEINSEEGDTLALTCYYAVFTRNGVEHFPVPLHDFSYLSTDTYQGPPGTKGVTVVDLRTGQTLIQGVTGSFQDAMGEDCYFIDLFIEAASLLSQIHEMIQRAIAYEQKLFSMFLLLNSITERLTGPAPASQDEEFEVVEDDPEEEEFEVVE
jgi:Flp pilus assembly protein TadD